MSLAGTAALTELWAKCKAWFGTKVTSSTTATTASIQLKNSADNALGSAATISAATTTAAGVMTADDRTKLNGIATGATANAATTTTPKMDGTAAVGTETAYAKGDHVHPTDTSRAASSHTHGNITNGGDITATAPTVASGDKLIINDESASKITNGPSFGTSTTTYLRNDGTWGTPAGTANQNAFSNVKVGSTTVAADTTTDTLELVAGSNVTLTPDATNDKVTIAATDTTYSDFTGATSSAAGTHGLVPAPASGYADRVLLGDGSWTDLYKALEQRLEIDGYDDTAGFLNWDTQGINIYDGQLMSSDQATKLSGIAAGAEVNQNAFSTVKVGSTNVAADAKTDTLELAGSNVTLTPDATNDKVTIGITASNVTTALGTTAVARATGDASGNSISGTYAPKASPALTGTPTAPTAAAGTNTTQIATTAFVKAAVDAAATGAVAYQGVINANTAISGLSSWTAGWYWVIGTAGTYVGQTCEVGDMVFCETTATTYSADNFTVVQNNIVEMTAAEVDAICV